MLTSVQSTNIGSGKPLKGCDKITDNQNVTRLLQRSFHRLDSWFLSMRRFIVDSPGNKFRGQEARMAVFDCFLIPHLSRGSSK